MERERERERGRERERENRAQRLTKPPPMTLTPLATSGLFPVNLCRVFAAASHVMYRNRYLYSLSFSLSLSLSLSFYSFSLTPSPSLLPKQIEMRYIMFVLLLTEKNIRERIGNTHRNALISQQLFLFQTSR